MTVQHPGGHDLLKHVHVGHPDISQLELIPPHDPREETPEYRATHHLMVVVSDFPCIVCGVRRSTLGDASQNPFGAKDLETHHRYIMRSLADACDPAKVNKYLLAPSVVDQASLLAWVDSPANMIVLCDVHHRSTVYGIHHVPQEVFNAQRYFYDGYIAVARTEAEAERAAQTDDQIAQAHGLEALETAGDA